VHETLNMAKLFEAPLLIICENNGWSEFSPTNRQIAFPLERLVTAFGIDYKRADGNDVRDVHAKAGPIISRVRAGGGPAVLECATTRVRGHYEGDAQKYRDTVEIEKLVERDPIRLTAGQLLAEGMTEADLSAIAVSVEREIEAAIAEACAGAEPDFAGAIADVYTPVLA
jgi:pyruvate dehydrogenase E1 component alpha subunit